MSERFVVVHIDGYTIGPGAPSGKLGRSFSVIDTAVCCREVGQFYSRVGSGKAKRLADATALAERLNRRDAWYLAKPELEAIA